VRQQRPTAKALPSSYCLSRPQTINSRLTNEQRQYPSNNMFDSNNFYPARKLQTRSRPDAVCLNSIKPTLHAHQAHRNISRGLGSFALIFHMKSNSHNSAAVTLSPCTPDPHTDAWVSCRVSDPINARHPQTLLQPNGLSRPWFGPQYSRLSGYSPRSQPSLKRPRILAARAESRGLRSNLKGIGFAMSRME
jgi:hypothetical protein